MARPDAVPASARLHFFTLLCLLVLTVNSKLAEKAEEAPFLSCICHIPLKGTNTMGGTCSSPCVYIAKHYEPLVSFQQELFLIASACEENITFMPSSNENAIVEGSYREGRFEIEVHYRPNVTGIPGFYACFHICISNESLEYEMYVVKNLIIGQSSSGVLYSYPDGFECKIDGKNTTPAGACDNVNDHTINTSTTLILLIVISVILGFFCALLIMLLCKYDQFISCCRKAKARFISILPSCNWLWSAPTPRKVPATSTESETDVEDESIAEHESGADETFVIEIGEPPVATALSVRWGPSRVKTQLVQVDERASDYKV